VTLADEYLEGVLKDAFERELEVDENVARTLPFFAATLALAVTLYGYAATKLPPPTWSFISIFLHALLMAGTLCLIPILWAMFQAVRVREYRIPPRETAQLEWGEELKAHYAAQGLTPKTVDARVAAHLRSRMLVEYAESAEHNRSANLPKLKARALGLTMLVVMLSIAFSMIGIIFITERAAAVGRTGATREPEAHSSEFGTKAAAQGGINATAYPATASGAPSGCEVPASANCQHGGRLTTPSNTSGAGAKPEPSVPAPSAPNPAPSPPAHQLLKKSEDGSAPLKRR